MRLPLSALVSALLLAACAQGSAKPAASTAAPVSLPTVQACPSSAAAGFPWPAAVPQDLPQPPHATYLGTETSAQGLTVVRFRTQSSLRDGVLFVVQHIQQAGFTLGRGDAEPAEADAPFGRGELRGVYKMLVRDTCLTDWLVAVTRVAPVGNSPLLPRVTTASPSPLPFG